MANDKKKCSISGAEYEIGSFADIIHSIIEAKDDAELKLQIDQLRSHLGIQQLQSYTNGALSEFVDHFGIRLKSIDQWTPQWIFEIGKWNLLGQVLVVPLHAFKWAEKLWKALYKLLCELQSSKGRIHKGTPLHNMGWVNLLQGNQLSMTRSQLFIKLAMIEDVLTDESTYKSTPAYRMLIGEHNIPALRLEELAKHVSEYKKKGDFMIPELVYLDYVIDPSHQERTSSWDFDEIIAAQLIQAVLDAKDVNSKGNSLELLMAYLFLSSQGFEVLKRRARTFDSEIDLIIRNLDNDEPARHELGQYILVECKNTVDKVEAKTVRDFSMKVMASSCNSGILISKEGISGDNKKDAARDAILTIIKIHQRHDVVIVPISLDEIQDAIKKQIPFEQILISVYEKTRFEMS